MVSSSLPLYALCGPLAASALIFATPARRALLPLYETLHVASIASALAVAFKIAADVVGGETLSAYHDWFMVDALGVIFLGLIGIVGFLTGAYSLSYIRHDLHAGALDVKRAKLYYALFSLFLAMMLLSVMANNIIMMWVAIEATTLGSAFLVGIYGKKSSLEAAWKYVIICTVGVAFGLYGAVLAYANSVAVAGDHHAAILWTTLIEQAPHLDPTIVKLVFVFALIGFGTKVGLFPMHAWLPDAHSEAPSPVSALLSGVLLKCALLAVIRYYAVTVRAVGPDFPQMLLLLLGGLSIAVAAMLFYVQQDLKRKLAYSSVEHVGLMALGLGIGGPLGVGAALLHAINHSFAKALLFCGSGNVLMKYGVRDLGSVKGMLRSAPISGLLIMAGALALAGFPPFNVFVSEFLVFAAGVKGGHIWLMVICALFFTVTVGGLIQIISGSVLGKCPEGLAKGDVGFAALAPMVVLFGLVLAMGVAVPKPVAQLIQNASAIVTGAPSVALTAPWQIEAKAERSSAVAAAAPSQESQQ
ncbi:hydrogenase-4 component F [Rhodoblastus acidophilus]|uniref:hydrogenase 4 subunit F n=1 Tax=Rhodoblastus acidophilus TaxID=1074 RepID=UPI002225AAA0|nr:hydrogenase 4 subunit F [Rhodoblastus acidophilus]MCW2285408.1 hydrogenase-4 component F [Rhodoblastus acidophilus]MCW2334343.1 hydrogenase-4 component F [Rhodoblastus acidophilus]